MVFSPRSTLVVALFLLVTAHCTRGGFRQGAFDGAADHAQERDAQAFDHSEPCAADHVLTCDEGSLCTLCTIFSTRSLADGAVVEAAGSLVVAAGGAIENINPTETFSLLLGRVTVQDGGRITGNLTLHVQQLEVESGGQIVADGLGHLGGSSGTNASVDGQGPGGGMGVSGEDRAGGGGGHGGAGGSGLPGSGGESHGDADAPQDFGSGGGANHSKNPGGNGGGRLRFEVADMMLVDGTISCQGARGLSVTKDSAGGGGAGGSLLIDAGSVTGAGSLSVRGGAGATTRDIGGAGGGGGGRILIAAGTAFGGTIDTRGGTGVYRSAPGQPGSFVLRLKDSTGLCDVGDPRRCEIRTPKKLPNGFMIRMDNLVVGSGGSLETIRPLAVISIDIKEELRLDPGAAIQANVRIASRDVRVGVGAMISADALGYAGGNAEGWGVDEDGAGPGGGRSSVGSGDRGGGGGGYGARGGDGGANPGSGGAPYGSDASPDDFGSGGGGWIRPSGAGGNGGGLVVLKLSGQLTLDGAISANGSRGLNSGSDTSGGGGSGGSVRIEAQGLMGAGSITAQGANGTGAADSGDSGGGGGGRIAIIEAAAPSFKGTISAAGGAATGAGESGQTGTALHQ